MRSTRRTAFLTALGTLVLALGGVFATAAPAAAVGCWNTSCNFKDPNPQGCAADARDASTRNATVDGRTIGKLRLRYSGNCGAYWVRWDPTVRTYYLQLSVWHPDSISALSAAESGQFYGPMLGRAGQETCYGAHIYTSRLRWIKWEFGACVR